MIARVLSRYADARLRAELDQTRDARDQARDTARRLFRRLQAARADLAAERARTAAALAHDPMPGFPCGNPACPCQESAATAIDAAERARTQETHQ